MGVGDEKEEFTPKSVLLPGFEPGMLDSKSRVITTSLQENQLFAETQPLI